jgi:EAL domain-containing protein (putative c-di-GMP-specific phosphodiesterase class I)
MSLPNRYAESPERRVLVLDDDQFVGSTLSSIVKTLGMQCRYVTSHEEFFKLTEIWQPTHILLDLLMPEMDGVEVMSRLGKRGCDAFFVLTSGVGTQLLDIAQRVARANGLQVVGVLPKPFSARSVKRLMQRSLMAADEETTAQATARPRVLIADEEIDQGLQQQEFELAFQPKVRCADLGLVGFEALIRWRHPRHGIVAPDRFIPQAEASGRIRAITTYVLVQALEWLVAYSNLDVTLSVNVSSRCLTDAAFTDELLALCDSRRVDPARIVLELTETAATEDPIVALNMLTRLRLRGVQLSIDDFGTGYSSMAQLAQLPFSELKIDKTFVMSARSSTKARSIIKSTVDLGRQLEMSVTAEGVETRDVLQYLCEIGCNNAQGYLVARPMDGAAAHRWTAPAQEVLSASHGG